MIWPLPALLAWAAAWGLFFGLQRAAVRRGSGTPDRFEGEQLGFHQGLREAYRKIAEDDPGRCVLIDANSDPDTVAGRVWAALRDRLLPTPASVVSA